MSQELSESDIKQGSGRGTIVLSTRIAAKSCPTEYAASLKLNRRFNVLSA